MADLGNAVNKPLEKIARGSNPELKERAKDVLMLMDVKMDIEEHGWGETINSFTGSTLAAGCPYLKQGQCHFCRLAKNQLGGPDNCSLQVKGYQNCYVLASGIQ